MGSESQGAESLAAIQVLTSLLQGLRRKGVMTGPELDHVLEQAEFPLERSTEPRAAEASRLITEMRARVRST